MEVPYVYCHWNPPCAFFGLGWGLILGHSMAWLYGQCIGIPWACIGLLIENAMAVLYEQAIGMSTWGSHGIALVLLHRSTMEVTYGKYIGNSPCGFYGSGWGLIIGNSIGMVLWLVHWDSMGLHRGAGHWEYHGSALWLSHWDVYMGLPWNCIGNAP